MTKMAILFDKINWIKKLHQPIGSVQLMKRFMKGLHRNKTGKARKAAAGFPHCSFLKHCISAESKSRKADEISEKTTLRTPTKAGMGNGSQGRGTLEKPAGLNTFPAAFSCISLIGFEGAVVEYRPFML